MRISVTELQDMEIPQLSKATQKGSFFGRYTSYTVEIASDRVGNTLVVERRYSDFYWLRNALVTHCPGALIPPLPRKKLLGRFDEKFIAARLRGLEDFLSRVLNHPVLGKEPYVLSFIEDSDCYSAKAVEERLRKENDSGDMAVWIKNKATTMTASPSQLENTEYTATEDCRMEPIKEHLYEGIAKRIEGVSKASHTLHNVMENTAPVIRHSGILFSELSHVIETDEPALGTCEREFSLAQTNFALMTADTASSMGIKVNEPIQRHCDTVIALKRSMAIQKEKRLQYLAAVSALERKKAQGGDAVGIVDQEIAMRRAQTDFESSTQLIVDDYYRYRQDRARQLITIMKSMAQTQIEYSRHAAALWSALAAKLIVAEEGSSSFLEYDRKSSLTASRITSQVSSSMQASAQSAIAQETVSTRYVDAAAVDSSRMSASEFADDDDIMIGV